MSKQQQFSNKRRFNKKGDRSQHLKDFQQQKDEIVRAAVEQLKRETGQAKVSEQDQKIRRMDTSMTSLQSMEQQLEALCMQVEFEEEIDMDDEMVDVTVYTDAWNPAPLCEYAWEMLDANMSTITATYADPNAFSAWVHAIMEDFVASQEQIIGIRGHTRETVNNAKARLQNLEIPEHIGLLLLMLRPMRIDGTNIQFVLLPHQVQTPEWAANPNELIVGNAINVVQHVCAATFSAPQLIVKHVGQVPVVANAPPCIRVNVLMHVTDAYCEVPVNGVVTGVANRMFGTATLTRAYPPMYRYHQFANTRTAVLHFTEVWYDFIYNVSFDHIFEKSFGRSFIMMGCQKQHAGRIVKELPMRVLNTETHKMVWNSGLHVKEMLVPWFECTDLDAARDFVLGVRAANPALNLTTINCISQRKEKNLSLAEWFVKLKMLCFGDGSKLFASLGR